MSSLTNAQVAQRVLDRLTGQGEDASNFYVPDIESWIPDGLYRVAQAVADSDEDYVELQKEISLTITASVAPISDATIMLDAIPRRGVVLVGTSELLAKPVPRFESLYASLQNDIYHYAIRNRQLIFRNITGPPYVGTLTDSGKLITNYIPTLAQLPQRYETKLIDALVEIALNRKDRTLPVPTSQEKV